MCRHMDGMNTIELTELPELSVITARMFWLAKVKKVHCCLISHVDEINMNNSRHPAHACSKLYS